MAKSIVASSNKSSANKAYKQAKSQLDQLNKLSRKIDLFKADIDFGDDIDNKRLGKLVDFNITIEEAINILSKM